MKRNKLQKTVFSVICIVLAVLGIGYFLYSYFFSDLFSRTEEVEVPQMVGQYYENFDRSRSYRGLRRTRR